MTTVNPTSTGRGFGAFLRNSAAAAGAALRGEVIAQSPAVQEPAPDQKLTIMVSNGTQAGRVLGGAFGTTEGGKFHVDPMLKDIYLFKLLDGVPVGGDRADDESQTANDVFRSMGGRPETTTLDVPGHLVEAVKATLVHHAAHNWTSMYAVAGSQIARGNPMAQLALNAEAQMVDGVVKRIIETLGQQPFTVQKTKRQVLRRDEVAGDSDDYDYPGEGPDVDDSYRVWTPISAPVAMREQATSDDVDPAQSAAQAPAMTAVPGLAEAGEEEARGSLAFAQVSANASVGDVIDFQEIRSATVMASSAEIAVEAAQLIERSLVGGLTDNWHVSQRDVRLNGATFVPTMPDDEQQDSQAPRG